MIRKSRRYLALLCALCMLFTSIPSSVMSDSVTTPTDLAPVREEQQAAPAAEEPAREAPKAEEPAAEEPKTEEAETEEPGAETPAAQEPAAEVPQAGDPAPEAPAAEPAGEETKTEETNPETPVKEKPAADRELAVSDDETVTGELEGNPPKDYLVRFTPERNLTLCLVLTADGEAEAAVTDEATGTVRKLVPEEKEEDGQYTLTLVPCKVKQGNTYLVRISARNPAAFSLRIVRKALLAAEETGTES